MRHNDDYLRCFRFLHGDQIFGLSVFRQVRLRLTVKPKTAMSYAGHKYTVSRYTAK